MDGKAMMKGSLLFLVGACLVFQSCLTSISIRSPEEKATSGEQNLPSTENIQSSSDSIANQAAVDEATVTIDVTPEDKDTSEKEENLEHEARSELFRLSIRGNFLEDKGLHEEASQVFAEAYQKYPQSAYLASMTGQSLLNAGKIEKAIEYATKAVEIDSHEIKALRVLGAAYSRQKQWNQAITYYEMIAGIDPHPVDALQDLAELYQKNNQYTQAIECYRQLIEINPYQETIYQYAIAILLYREERFIEALDAYRKLAEMMPYNAEIMTRIGSIQERMGKIDEAIETYLTALDKVKNSQEELAVRKRLATLYQVRNSTREALHQYTRIKKLSPENLEIRKTLANLYIEQNQYEKALEEVKSLTETSPGNYPIHALKKDILLTLDREKEAWISFMDAFEQALHKSKKNDIELFLLELGEHDTFRKLSSYHQLERFTDLLNSANDIEKTPRIPFVQANLHFYLDQTEALKENLDLILSRLQEAISQGDGEWANEIIYEMLVWYRLRSVFEQQGKTQELIDLLDKGIHVFPETLNLLKVAGLASMDLEEWRQAQTYLVKAFEQAQGNNNAFQSVLYPLATVYDKLGKVDEVERLMRQAIEKFPKDPQPYNFLGYTFAEHGIRLKEAKELIEKAVELDPHDGNILDSLGWVHYRQGNTEKAIQHLKRAIELKENHPVILDHLGDAYAKNGRLDKAIQYWKKSLQYGPKYPLEFTAEFESEIKKKIRETESNIIP